MLTINLIQKLKTIVLQLKFLYRFTKDRIILLIASKNKLPHPLIHKVLRERLNAWKLLAINEILEESKSIRIIARNTADYLSFAPKFGIGNTLDKTIYTRNLESYVALIHNCYLVGGSSIVFFDKLALCDLLLLNNENLRCTDEGIRQYNSKFCVANLPRLHSKKVSSIDRAINLTGNATYNYYHLFLENLLKFEHIEKFIDDLNIPVIVDEVVMQVPQFKELLNYLNKNQRPILTLKKHFATRIDELYHFSPPNFVTINFWDENLIKPTDNFYLKKSIQYARKELLTHKAKKVFPRRVFLSRKNATNRRSFNESEILRELKKYGFEEVYPEHLSIAEQISLFNEAEFIIGGSGAAFTNIIFCTSNCKVIILARNTIPFSGFSSLAEIVGINLIYITQFENCLSGGLHASFEIDINKLSFVIEKMI